MTVTEVIDRIIDDLFKNDCLKSNQNWEVVIPGLRHINDGKLTVPKVYAKEDKKIYVLSDFYPLRYLKQFDKSNRSYVHAILKSYIYSEIEIKTEKGMTKIVYYYKQDYSCLPV